MFLLFAARCFQTKDKKMFKEFGLSLCPLSRVSASALNNTKYQSSALFLVFYMRLQHLNSNKIYSNRNYIETILKKVGPSSHISIYFLHFQNLFIFWLITLTYFENDIWVYTYIELYDEGGDLHNLSNYSS